jgi:phosphate transport system permease protein
MNRRRISPLRLSRMARHWRLALLAAALLASASAPALAREEIRIVGSSTVYPFATTVAENFSRNSGFKPPVVEATGTGGGLKLFCSGIGIDSPDIANASRRIKESEIETCGKNGAGDIAEVKIGYDGIVLAQSKAGAPFSLSVRTVWLALAKQVPVNGALAANPYRNWNEIDPSLPAERIEVLGPPPTSGTRDAFVELVMDKGCELFPEVAALEGDARKAACQTVREDGAYIEAGENDNLIVQKLEANAGALGIFGYSFLEQNGDKMRGAPMDGVAPGFDAIASGQYEVSRALYIYVKKAHLGVVPGIREYVTEFTSDAAAGAGGYLADKGLVPLPDAERQQMAALAASLVPAGAASGAAASTTETPRAALVDRSSLIHSITMLAMLGLMMAAYMFGRQRASALTAAAGPGLHSRPGYHGLYVALWCGVPALIILALWLSLEPMVLRSLTIGELPPDLAGKPTSELNLILNDIGNIIAGAGSSDPDGVKTAAAARLVAWRGWSALALALAIAVFGIAGLAWGRGRLAAQFRARNRVERMVEIGLIVLSTLSILTTIGIVLSLLFESLRFFARVPFFDFLFGLQWSPQTAIRADQVGASGSFGAVPLLTGTLLVTFIAMLVAVPIGLMSAVYMADYASPRLRAVAKPVLEILAGIPTVVYGFFAALIVAPFLRQLGMTLGLDVASESALAAGAVMGVMIIPFVSSLSDDAMNAVPQALRDGSFALGATKSETIRQVVIPAALPGIVGGVLLAISRAIGETMIVVMAAGLSANLTANPLEAVTTVTVQIVTLLVGDQEFDSAKTLAAFALGLLLFAGTLVLNVIALIVVRRYREKYD